MIPFLNILQCSIILSEYSSESSVTFFISIIAAFVGIGFCLLRFIEMLRQPYQKNNIHVVISSIFAIITFFAVVYSSIAVFVPNSFHELIGESYVDNIVNVLYFSVITFTTVGYGDIYPVASVAKAFVSVETMSFFIFFVILTSNHKVFLKPKENKEDE